jgi:nucleoside-diphosphate-sugar epimerase
VWLLQTIRRVNIGGTLLLLKASAAANVAAFVYTSSYNVVFGGQPIVDGDEDTCPYFPPGLQVSMRSNNLLLHRLDVDPCRSCAVPDAHRNPQKK